MIISHQIPAKAGTPDNMIKKKSVATIMKMASATKSSLSTLAIELAATNLH